MWWLSWGSFCLFHQGENFCSVNYFCPYNFVGQRKGRHFLLCSQWKSLGDELKKLRRQMHKPQAALTFTFVEVRTWDEVRCLAWVCYFIVCVCVCVCVCARAYDVLITMNTHILLQKLEPTSRWIRARYVCIRMLYIRVGYIPTKWHIKPVVQLISVVFKIPCSINLMCYPCGHGQCQAPPMYLPIIKDCNEFSLSVLELYN